MANNLTGLYPTLYEALDVVSREQVGYIPAVARSSKAERAAKGQTITWPVVPPGTAGDIAPAASGPTGSDTAVGAPTISIGKSRSVPVYLTGEELMGLRSGETDQIIIRDAFAQAMRTLCNEIEADLALLAKIGASRAVGAAGTAPFATANDLSDLAAAMKVLDDNGAPNSDRHAVMNSAAMVNLRGKQSVGLGQAGAGEVLRTGSLANLLGIDIHQSGGISLHTKGTGAAYVTSGATAPGVTDVALVTGSGTVLAGDVVTFAADAVNKYVIGTGVAAPGTIKLNKPGAMVTIPTGDALTVGNNYTQNSVFSRNALALAVRLPAAPPEGDAAFEVVEMRDPASGLVFEIRAYRQYRRIAYEVGIAWGGAIGKAEHLVTLLG
ncbi:MAG: P22 phage major capsid protein family protein [Bellilinea sp.]